MITGIWGKKIGMTQVFSESNKVVPVTVIDVSQWVITQIKTHDRQGYQAVQMGRIRDEYLPEKFSPEWLKNTKKYFSVLREVPVAVHQAEATDASPGSTEMQVGQVADIGTVLAKGDNIDITGITIGRGFQGVMKRHGFSGGPASHGGKLGRRPGSLSFMRRQGRVVKGKKLPGHMGVEQRVMKNLKVIKVEPGAHVVFVSGSVPGKTGSLVFMRKRG